MKKVIFAFVVAAFLSGCAASQNPAYVSMNEYADYNCKQLAGEKKRISNKLNEAHSDDGAQAIVNTAIIALAASKGQGVYLQKDKETELLKNQYDVVERTEIKKSCNL